MESYEKVQRRSNEHDKRARKHDILMGLEVLSLKKGAWKEKVMMGYKYKRLMEKKVNSLFSRSMVRSGSVWEFGKLKQTKFR